MTKIQAIDYKGKYFLLEDDDYMDENGMDFVLDYVDVDKIINDEKALENHVAQCIYYGIPAYIGQDKELNKKIAEMYLKYHDEE